MPEIVSTVCHCLEQFPENLQLQQEIFAFLVPVLAISGASLIHTQTHIQVTGFRTTLEDYAVGYIIFQRRPRNSLYKMVK